MLLPRGWGYLSAALAFILFGSILELDYYLIIPSYSNSHPKLKALQVVIFVNLFAYFAIAYLAGLLMSKLRQVDVQLKDASGALENLQALHENIVQSMSGGVITTGLDGRITLVNRAAQHLLEISEAEAAALGDQSKMAGTDGMTRILEVFGDAELRLRDASSKKILLEITLLKAIEARHAVSLDSVLKQLQNLRENSGPDIVSIPVPTSSPAVAPSKPFRAQTAAARPIEPEAPRVSHSQALPVSTEPQDQTNTVPAFSLDADLTDLWSKLLEAVGRVSQFTRTYLLEANPVCFKNNVFTIGFDPEFEDHIGLVDNSRNHTLLQTKLSELGHPNTQIKFIKAEAPARPSAPGAVVSAAPGLVTPSKTTAPGPARSAAAPATKEKLMPMAFDKESFKNDPLIQKALEIFKGQIVEVRA